MIDNVTIPRKEYEELLDDQLKLMALEKYRVDTWSLYEKAIAKYKEWRDSGR